MAQEIERKFILTSDDWRQSVSHSEFYRQGYLASNEKSSIRVRIAADNAWLNIKSATLGIQRTEFEYEIPLADANVILDQLSQGAVIEKTRYFVPDGDHLWEIDVFERDNAGLVVAEIELDDEHESFNKPAWVGEEVSDDPRYYNVCLVDHPYCDWDT